MSSSIFSEAADVPFTLSPQKLEMFTQNVRNYKRKPDNKYSIYVSYASIYLTVTHLSDCYPNI